MLLSHEMPIHNVFATKFALSTLGKWVFHGLNYLPNFRLLWKINSWTSPLKLSEERVKGLAPPLGELVMSHKNQLHKRVKNKAVAGEGMQKNLGYRLLKILFLSRNTNRLAENIYLNSSYENVYIWDNPCGADLVWALNVFNQLCVSERQVILEPCCLSCLHFF